MNTGFEHDLQWLKAWELPPSSLGFRWFCDAWQFVENAPDAGRGEGDN